MGFYAYSALATDRYPPFTLRATDYPATIEIEYPEQLSRGLVLVKWWLLAIPHYVVVSILNGGGIGQGSGGLTGVLTFLPASFCFSPGATP